MADKFFAQTLCDRCGEPLTAGRTMSRFNTECICMKCSEKERQDPEYTRAVETEIAEILKGNYHYKGIRG